MALVCIDPKRKLQKGPKGRESRDRPRYPAMASAQQCYWICCCLSFAAWPIWAAVRAFRPTAAAMTDEPAGPACSSLFSGLARFLIHLRIHCR